MKSGIYKWTSPSGKYYIGQAVNLKRRYNDFLNWKRPYTNKGSAIDNARNKYDSKDLWTYEVIEYADREQLDDLEIKYIELFDSYNSRIGYNSNKGGNGNKGYRPTEETKRKMSESKKGKYKGKNNPNYGHHLSEEAKERIRQSKIGRKQSRERRMKNAKKIIQLTLDNKVIKVWDMITEAAHSLGCDVSTIIRVCKGKQKTAKGYHWKYA